MNTPNEVATQQTYKVGDFEFPGLATSKEGGITPASFVDMMVVCLASLEHPAVDKILTANEIVIRDVNGQLFFPRAK